MKNYILATMVVAVSMAQPALANELISNSAEGAQVYLISPQDGEVVSQQFKVQFGLAKMGVAPAGAKLKNTGHHHVLIDTDIKSIDFSTSLPATENIRHYGGGQTEGLLTLSPGTHTLQLLLGNYVHIPHKKPVLSEKITITVK